MNKLVYVGIIIFCIGIIALPETYALFENQHTFYDLKSAQGVPCLKCHNDVAAQMNSPSTPHSTFKCGDCHKINMVEQGTHAATVPLCMDCHGGQLEVGGKIDPHTFGTPGNCTKCHDAQDLIGSVQKLNVTSSINNSKEPHKSYIQGATNDSMMVGSNEACIGCHTAVQVNITWEKPTTITFKVNRNNGEYTVNNFGEI